MVSMIQTEPTTLPSSNSKLIKLTAAEKNDGGEILKNSLEMDEDLIDDHHDLIKVKAKAKVELMMMIQPHSGLPKPEAPPGVNAEEEDDEEEEDEEVLVPSQSQSQSQSSLISDIIRSRSNTLSAAISKRFNSLKETTTKSISKSKSVDVVTVIDLSGVKVVVNNKNNYNMQLDLMKGRATFFSRSNCRDCTAVRMFFRERGIRYVEINVDVYPERSKELIKRTGGNSHLPQIFFNDSLFGGLVELNSLRNNNNNNNNNNHGNLIETRLRELLRNKCSADAPAPPVYGFDQQQEEDDHLESEYSSIIKLLRQKLPIQDRVMKMKLVKNCFSGTHMVELLIQHFDSARHKAVEIGKQLAAKHFIHHVFGDINDFEDGNHFYRFLEHETYIPKCYNFNGSTNDSEPKDAIAVGIRLTKIMSAILESYASQDMLHIDYFRITTSEEFRRYINLAQDLQRVELRGLSSAERLAFFLNLYNAMVIHAIIRIGTPDGVIDSRTFFSDFQYIVGGYAYSLNTIKHGILRNNRRPPYSLVKLLGNGDKRLPLAICKVNPLIHFGLCDGTVSSPVVRFFTAEGVEAELRSAAREFFRRTGIEVDLDKRTVYLTRIIKWYSGDFGAEKEMVKWVINYLDSTKAGLLTHLLNDGAGHVSIVYDKYNWGVNK